MTDTSPLSDIGLSDSDIEKAFGPSVIETLDPSSPKWKNLVNTQRKAIRKQLWRRRLYNLLGKSYRNTSDVTDGYNRRWANGTYGHIDGKPAPCAWRDRTMLALGTGTTRVHQLCHMRAIEKFKPRTVLEVGSGTGYHLFALSARFPQTRFTGLELTRVGVEVGADVKKNDILPDVWVETAPEPLLDLTAHKRTNLVQGDASRLPFADGSFDFVYTSIALEQMDHIREQVFAEIRRVATGHVAFCEPWRDFNDSGYRREYILAREYFAARVSDLKKFGLKPIFVSNDIPYKFRYSIAYVIAEVV